jgi:hypothetical protein
MGSYAGNAQQQHGAVRPGLVEGLLCIPSSHQLAKQLLGTALYAGVITGAYQGQQGVRNFLVHLSTGTREHSSKVQPDMQVWCLRLSYCC